jgi:hypothetical protein
VALDREIERIRNDTAQWRALALRLSDAGRDALTDWELDFLEEIPRRTYLEQLSHRQAEVLLLIQDSIEIVSSYRDYSVKWLCATCYENRLDLDEEDQAGIERLYATRPVSLRRREARRLLSLIRRIGYFEQD